MQDEIAWLRAQLKEEVPNRIKVESDFKSNRGYKSIHARIREQVLANKRKHSPIPLTPETDAFKEEQYEKVEVND